jgi:O-antigen/teichoic acid export membrane protein
VFHNAVVMVLFPRAVSRPAREVLDMTGRAVRMTTFATTLCGAGIMLVGPHLLALLYGAEYRGAAAILRILVIEVVLAGATQVMSQAFMALGRPGVITILQAIGLLFTIPLMLVLVPRFGIEGAAFSLLLSTCARFAFVLASFPRFLNLPRPALLPRRADLLFLFDEVSRRLRILQPTVAGGEA